MNRHQFAATVEAVTGDCRECAKVCVRAAQAALAALARTIG